MPQDALLKGPWEAAATSPPMIHSSSGPLWPGCAPLTILRVCAYCNEAVRRTAPSPDPVIEDPEILMTKLLSPPSGQAVVETGPAGMIQVHMVCFL